MTAVCIHAEGVGGLAASKRQVTTAPSGRHAAPSAHHLGAAGGQDEGDLGGAHQRLGHQHGWLLNPRDDACTLVGACMHHARSGVGTAAAIIHRTAMPARTQHQKAAKAPLSPTFTHREGRRPPLLRRARCGPPRWCTSWRAGAGTAPAHVGRWADEMISRHAQLFTSLVQGMHNSRKMPGKASHCAGVPAQRTSALRVLRDSSALKMAVEVGFCSQVEEVP